ncbi:hypothetical protein QM012_002761 [Aureobasidium pullulans]|uniref:Transcription factor domain-containing protein n=1 Tax=Aureobasidium pullulans TaxID=5580 RepID=A0ABR0TBW4_AURPU
MPGTEDVRQSHSLNSSPGELIPDFMSLEQRTSLVGGVAYLSLCASGTTDSTFEPYYIGSNSGSTIARVIQASIFGQTKPKTTAETASSPLQARSEPRTPPESVHSAEASLRFPETQQARILFDTFFERIHTRWPVLDRSIYEDLFAKHFPVQPVSSGRSHKEPHSPAQGVWSNVEPFIHIIRLDRIHSRIHKVVFRVDRDVLNGTAEEQAKRDRKMAIIKADLDGWLEKCPQTPKDGNKTTWMYDPESAYLDARDFYGLQYHKSILFLFTNFLPSLPTSDPRFLICARSATSVCIAYKRLNQNKTLTYTMISLHSCFVAGLTLIYCIWRDRSLFSYDILEATRDCSQSLTIFGEKWPGAVKYRDIFDELSGSLLKSIVNPAASRDKLRQSQLNPDNLSNVPVQAQQTQQPIHLQIPLPANHSSNVAGMPMISDAVREAFMEVDEEAPGGWQGWRMWDEMVRETASGVNDPDLSSRSYGQNYGAASWECYNDTYDLDPVQDAVMQTGSFGTVNDSSWDYMT